MYVERHRVSLTTDASGAATGYTPAVTGRILAVKYNKTDYANGVDFTITSEDTGQNIWVESDVNAAKTVAPRQATHSTAGVAALYAAGGTAVNVEVFVASERIKIVLAQGGDTKSGSFDVFVG